MKEILTEYEIAPHVAKELYDYCNRNFLRTIKLDDVAYLARSHSVSEKGKFLFSSLKLPETLPVDVLLKLFEFTNTSR